MILEVENLSKTFTLHHLNKEIPALKNISFSLEYSGFLGIIGKSGSGKSTILKNIYRSYLPSSGHIWYYSKNEQKLDLSQASEQEIIHLRKKEIGYVSQFLSSMPRTTAYEFVKQSVLKSCNSSSETAVSQRVEELLQHFDIHEQLWQNYPSTFSGGEKLRLNIAAAIAKNPRLLLLDEPTASLDDDSKLKVREAIEKLKEQGTSMIGIFHDLDFMEGLCTQVIEMKAGQIIEK